MRALVLPILILLAVAFVCGAEEEQRSAKADAISEESPVSSSPAAELLQVENSRLKKENLKLTAKLERLPPSTGLVQAQATSRRRYSSRRRYVVVHHVSSRRRYYSRYGNGHVYVESGSGGIIGSIVGGIFFLCICGIVLCVVCHNMMHGAHSTTYYEVESPAVTHVYHDYDSGTDSDGPVTTVIYHDDGSDSDEIHIYER